MREPAYGTVDIARMIGMSRITIHHWIKAGRIRAFRTPGRHYRVTRSDLVAFLEQAELPLPDALGPAQRQPRGVWIGGDGRLLEAIGQAASFAEDVSSGSPADTTGPDAGAEGPIAEGPIMAWMADPWAAMIRVGRLAPDLVVLDPALDEALVLALCDALAGECPVAMAVVVLRPAKGAGGADSDIGAQWQVFRGSPRTAPGRLAALEQVARHLTHALGRVEQ